MNGSRLFTAWLKDQKVSLAFTTYQAGKLFLIGMNPNGGMSVFERTFERCMGLGVGQRQLWMSTLYQLWRFENFLDPGEQHEGYDATFVPVTGHTTGDVDIHDIHVQADGSPLFVVTRFNCLATLSEKGSFRPVWTPSFIDRVAAEDRCHLNGMATDESGARYVTCVGQSNIVEGWREHRRDGGLVIDVASNETVATGLSMPHSPRLHQGKLWILQTGTGEFGTIEPEAGTFTPVCFLPGFARGMSFVGDYAVIGLSRPRENRTFEGLVLNERLEREGASPKCALCIVNLKTGDIEHRLEMEGIVQELYDVVVLPDTQRPKALGFRSDEIRFAVRPDVTEGL
ncbi:MAG: TIGR03032 family protein [Rhodobacteraceae bacterium]|nr:TIGR03032 family protein [Paracoccaceae bacterium]